MPATDTTNEDGSAAPLNKTKESMDDGPLPDNITGQSTVILQGGREMVGTEKDLDENAYGCAAVALVRESTKLAYEVKSGKPISLTIVRLVSSLSLMAVNLILQFAILIYISHYVVEPAVRDVQMTYRAYHAYVFDTEGKITEDWHTFPWAEEVCSVTMADPTFYILILLLWTIRILDELRRIDRFLEEVYMIRSCATSNLQLEFTETGDPELGGRCLITHLTWWMRMVLLLVVALPRLFIALYLLVLGCRWLSASANFADMVLNALALVFVTDIDELLYDSILPHALKKQIADTNWFFIEDQFTRAEVEKNEWFLYRRTAFWLFNVAAFLGLYGQYFQSVLPFGVADIAEHCQQRKAEMETPLCTLASFKGIETLIQECYPFGK